MELSYRIIKKHNLNFSEDSVRINSNNSIYRKEILDFDSENNTREKDSLEESQKAKVATPTKEEVMRDFMEDLEVRKEKILKEIITEAHDQAIAIKDKAMEEGFAEGHARGFRTGIEESAKEGENIKRKAILVFKQCEEEAENYLQLQKDKILKLAGDMAKSIINYEIDTDNQRIIDMINPIIRDYKRAGTVVISCNDSHQKALKKNVSALTEINPELEFIILRNPDLEKNAVTLEYQNQIIDLNISQQIESMVAELQSLEV